MFVILVTYKVSLDQISPHIPGHVDFLKKGYELGYFIVSGQKEPDTGGIILCRKMDRRNLEDFLKKDPFSGLVSYEIIEFKPSRFDKDFARFMGD